MSHYPTLFGCRSGTSGRVVAVGVPYDRGTSSEAAGAAGAPAALRKLSRPEHCRMDLHGLFDLARRKVVVSASALSDLGDLRFRTRQTDEDYLAFVADAVRVLAIEGKRPLVLGGDHSVTLAVLRGLSRAGRRVQVIQIDAHHDYEPIDDHERPTHASFVSFAAREGLFAQVLQIGVRGLDWGEHPAPPGVRSIALDELSASLLPGVDAYLTVDTDGFDPVFAGAVGYPEPEGLPFSALRSVLACLHDAGIDTVGADWTEYNPALDGPTSLTGAFVVRGLAHVVEALATDVAGEEGARP